MPWSFWVNNLFLHEHKRRQALKTCRTSIGARCESDERFNGDQRAECRLGNVDKLFQETFISAQFDELNEETQQHQAESGWADYVQALNSFDLMQQEAASERDAERAPFRISECKLQANLVMCLLRFGRLNTKLMCRKLYGQMETFSCCLRQYPFQ